MNVLWFECTTPGRYKCGEVLGGWQDSLEAIVRTAHDVNLTVAFEVYQPSEEKIVDGVRYIPIHISYTNKENKLSETTWDISAQKMLDTIEDIVHDVNPDIIHVFGTEWSFGLIAEKTKIPVVIHIQGSIVTYNNAMFPPRYSVFDVIRNEGLRHPVLMYKAWKKYQCELSREYVERRVWKAVSNYMGRTRWDEAMSAVMHPGRKYFHVDEALRPSFLGSNNVWNYPPDGKIRLLSTGIISFRKGIDMMLKTAEILKSLCFDFEWHVAGVISVNQKQIIQRKEGRSFDNCNIIIHGFLPSDEVNKLLSETTIYIHTAYAENSPNSICEAQYLGIPVISTNVGGISTLVCDGIDGILVPANDPWSMVYEIMQLASDKERMKAYSLKSREKALKRHNPDVILQQLLHCYKILING